MANVFRGDRLTRDARLVAWLDSLRADAVFGWRQLMKRKVTSGAAILSLALATGACTSAFRLIDALLLRPLPISHPERLYSVAFAGAGADGRVLGPMLAQMGEGEGQQGIPGKDRRGFVIGLVNGGLAAAKVVIVHGRQVVVDQRIAVDELDRDGGGEAQLRGDAKHLGGFPQQEGPDALAAIEGAMPHGLEQAIRGEIRARDGAGPQEDIQRLLDFGGVLLQFLLERGHGGALPETGKNH